MAMSRFLNRVGLFVSVMPTALLLTAGGAAAQDAAGAAVELPDVDVVVLSPSPVVKKKPVRRRAPVEQSAPQQQPASQPSPQPVAQPTAAPTNDEAEAAPPPARTKITPPPGTLLVVDDAFVPITVVTERDILSASGANVADSLAQRPGISGTTFTPGANRPVIRGLDTYRVRTQENGIGTGDVAALSEDHAVPIDPYAADQVEVVRGPATLRYGSQAIGGVVSVENQRVPTAMPRNGFSGRLSGGLSSVDDGRDGSFAATAGAQGVVVHMDGFKREGDDYDTPVGIVENAFVDQQGLAGGASLVGPDGFIGVAVSRFESQYGIAGEEAFIDLEQDKVLSRGEWRVRDYGIEAIRYWFGASDYQHSEIDLETGDTGSLFTTRAQEGRVEVQHSEIATGAGALNGAVGMQVSHRRLQAQSFEGDSLLEPNETDQVAGFIFEELDITKQTRLQLALRIEHTQVDGTGLADFSDPAVPVLFAGERSFTPVSVSGGILQDIAMGVVGRVTAQYVERAPDAAELFSKGLHEATETFEIGNPNLGIEAASTIEFGFKKANGALRFDATGYHTNYDGFIFKQLTGVGCGDTLETCGAEDELNQLVFIQRDARFYGVEIGAQLDIAPIWRGVWGIEGQYDFVHAEFDAGENVPRIPPHRLGGGVFYRDANWLARTGLLHAFDQNRIGINETPTDGYKLWSAELSYTTPLSETSGIGTALTVGVRGENLLDDEVRNHVSFRTDDVPLPGANVRVFGTLKFN